MARNSIASIDAGSASIRVLVAEYSPEEQGLIIRSLVKVPSEGIKNGYVVNADAAREAVGVALSEAERMSGVKLKKICVGIGGMALSTQSDTATIAISRADGVVSELDVDRVQKESENRITERPNTKILHTIPSEYKVDGRKILGKPVGHVGGKLEVRTFFITAATPHVEALVSVIESHGTEVGELYASPVAESIVTLSPTARNAGSLLVNLGAESVSLLSYEDSVPTSLKVFPLGSVDITHDIALGLRIPLEEAEQLKLGILSERRSPTNTKTSKKVTDIIDARLSDIFELIDTHLKKIGRSGLLPAGVVFTGEGSHVKGVDDLARKELGLPARLAKNFLPSFLEPSFSQNIDPRGQGNKQMLRAKERLERVRDPEWSVALGLTVLGFSGEPEESLGIRVAKRTKSGVINFLRQFLP